MVFKPLFWNEEKNKHIGKKRKKEQKRVVKRKLCFLPNSKSQKKDKNGLKWLKRKTRVWNGHGFIV